MKVTMAEIINTNPALGRLLQSEELPNKQRYDLMLLVAKLKAPLEAYGKIRQDVGLKLSGGEDSIPAERVAEFAAEMEPIHATEHDLNIAPCEISASKIKRGDDTFLLCNGNLVSVIDQPAQLKEALALFAENSKEELLDGETESEKSAD